VNNYTIVSVNVSQILAATPNNLQSTGCIISQGSTTLASGHSALLTQASDYTALLSGTPEAHVQVQVNDFFAQGNTQAVYILELGTQTSSTTGIAALATYLAAPAMRFYTYACPPAWDAVDAFVTLVGQYAALTAMTYFFIDTETLPVSGSTYVSPYATIKSVVCAATQLATESPSAALMWMFLNSAPSETNKLAPFAFRYVNALTVLNVTNPAKQALGTAFINYIGTGAEGGIANTIVFGGCASDGKDLMQWYAVDWVQINGAQALANAVINGSNNAQNPLYYSQAGINTLENVLQNTMNSATSFGLTAGSPKATAVPFLTYIAAHPNDYGVGLYSGLAVTAVPNRGFKNIVFNFTVDFSGQSLLTTTTTP